MPRHALTLIAALALAACQGSGEPPTRPPPPPPQATGTLALHDGAGGAGPLRLATLKRLAIDATYQGEPGTHSLRLDVLGPNGQLYAQLLGTLQAGPDGAGAASDSLEVAGTPVEGYHMTGTWRVVLSMDGGQALASASVEFVD